MTAAQMRNAVFLDALSVPCPGEVFAAMNKACRPNWATLVTPATAPVTSNRNQLALVVGVLAANGYIAVEAQDGQQVKNVGREILAVAKSLGVSKALMGRGNSLVEFAENSAWEALADELEATENEVKTTMIEQKDKDLVTLTSAAAWLRGLEVASGVVLAGDNLQGAAVLRQAELARHLASQLENLSVRMKRDTLVSSIAKVLESVAAKLDALEPRPSHNSKGPLPDSNQERDLLQQIHDEAGKMVKSILAFPVPASTSSPSSPVPSPA